MKLKALAAALMVAAGSSAAFADERIASFDLGSLDTLDALGASDQVVGLPKQALPAYLSQFDADDYTDLGGLKSPDLDAIAQSEPSLIVYTGRQNEWVEEMGDIAPLLDASLQGDDYLEAFDANVREIARHVDAETQAEDALEALHSDIEAKREALDDSQRVLVIMHNDGKFMLNTSPIVHEVLGIDTLEIPDSVESETHGSRVFTPLTMDNISEMHPDVVLVIDRSAAIGNEPANAETIEQALADAGADTRLVILSPKLWYLSGGGLESLQRQLDEVVEAL